ncbi:unnamed protein product [Pedinophyceae sp. YPF-701]|nr:unnamed protein product [Pedinophyceae sp. YPF-701]
MARLPEDHELLIPDDLLGLYSPAEMEAMMGDLQIMQDDISTPPGTGTTNSQQARGAHAPASTYDCAGSIPEHGFPRSTDPYTAPAWQPQHQPPPQPQWPMQQPVPQQVPVGAPAQYQPPPQYQPAPYSVGPDPDFLASLPEELGCALPNPERAAPQPRQGTGLTKVLTQEAEPIVSRLRTVGLSRASVQDTLLSAQVYARQALGAQPGGGDPAPQPSALRAAARQGLLLAIRSLLQRQAPEGRTLLVQAIKGDGGGAAAGAAHATRSNRNMDPGHAVEAEPENSSPSGSGKSSRGRPRAEAQQRALTHLQGAVCALLDGTGGPLAELGRKAAEGRPPGAAKCRGVTKHSRTGRFEGHLWFEGKQWYLGGFWGECQAAMAHDIAALKCRGAKAQLNFERALYDPVAEDLPAITLDQLITALRAASKGVPADAGASPSALKSPAPLLSPQPTSDLAASAQLGGLAGPPPGAYGSGADSGDTQETQGRKRLSRLGIEEQGGESAAVWYQQQPGAQGPGSQRMSAVLPERQDSKRRRSMPMGMVVPAGMGPLARARSSAIDESWCAGATGSLPITPEWGAFAAPADAEEQAAGPHTPLAMAPHGKTLKARRWTMAGGAMQAQGRQGVVAAGMVPSLKPTLQDVVMGAARVDSSQQAASGDQRGSQEPSGGRQVLSPQQSDAANRAPPSGASSGPVLPGHMQRIASSERRTAMADASGHRLMADVERTLDPIAQGLDGAAGQLDAEEDVLRSMGLDFGL